MHQDEKRQLRVPGYLGRFLDSLAVRCDWVTCFMHSPRQDEMAQQDYIIQSNNVTWINIGPHTSVLQRMRSAKHISEVVRQHSHELDVMLIRGPSPLLPTVAQAVNIPTALLLVGDYLAGVDDLPQPRWRKEAIRAWMYWNYRQQLSVAKRSLTFVNSHQLYEQYKTKVHRLVETRTTTLNEEDFYEREDTCQTKPIRLLYTGRIDRAKGLFEMVYAVELLVRAGYDVVLDLVGWPARKDTILDELKLDASARGVTERVFYHGFKAVGPELFAYYKDADIYVIASQSSFEGFPRTIWEAMAHSLPVVATKVGSIPYYLEDQHNALLIEPRRVDQLAKAIEKIINEASLRQKLIANAFTVAKQNTLDKLSDDLILELVKLLTNNDSRKN